VTSFDIACDDKRAPSAGPGGAEAAITIYVCVTCRAGLPLDLVPIPGEVLAAATARAAVGTAITVQRARER